MDSLIVFVVILRECRQLFQDAAIQLVLFQSNDCFLNNIPNLPQQLFWLWYAKSISCRTVRGLSYLVS